MQKQEGATMSFRLLPEPCILLLCRHLPDSTLGAFRNTSKAAATASSDYFTWRQSTLTIFIA
jgi:hypothetical protein